MAKQRSKKEKQKSINPHKSFKRSYREDYLREAQTPGIMQHVVASFKIIFKNWKLFLPFLVIMVILYVVLVGITSESSYVKFQDTLNQANVQMAGQEIGGVAKAGILLVSMVTTGITGESSGTAAVFGVLLFLVIWLVTIFFLRHKMAGHQVTLQDGLYNAMTPMISTFVVFVVALIQCVPIFILIIAYSAAVQTEFLATPFYALMFFVFAALMILLSGYLLSSSLMALVAVSAPGLYPAKALRTASDLMMGQRIRFVLRLVALIIVLVILWVVIMLPLILFDMWVKSFEWTAGIPFIPICFTVMMCFTYIYVTTYLYMYYRWMLKI